MPSIKVYNMQGVEVSETTLSEGIFGIEPNPGVVHMVVKNQLANKRQGTQSALTRAEVRGGGRKPWRQKGTGRARQGSIRAPQWYHGGVVFAPKPRSYRFSLNKKVRRLALKSVFSSKLLENNIIILDSMNMTTYKTKEVIKMMSALSIGKALFVNAEKNEYFVKSAANIPGVATALVNTINVYDMLRYEKLVISLDALKQIEEVYA